MLTKEQAGDVFDRIRKLSSADEVEVLFSGGRFALTRFANNTIHQNVAEENHIVSVRTVFGQRTARATTNKFDDESLRQVVRSSENLAKVQHPDPDLLPMPSEDEAAGRRPGPTGEAGEITASALFVDDLGADSLDPVELVMAFEEAFDIEIPDEDAEKIRTVQDAVDYIGKHAKAVPTRVVPSRYFEQTAGITPELRADGVRKIVDVADRHKLITAGVFSSGEYFEGILNSRGLGRWHRHTLAEVSITMLAADSSGWQKANSPDVANLDPVSLAETATQKAVETAHPREIPAGKYTVILEPAAVLDIVGFMFWDYSGMAILDQRSFLTGRIGMRLFGDNITIADDVGHPLQSGSPFDGEGVTRRTIPLVENGIVKRVVYARTTAERMKKSEYRDKVGPIEATGHGFPLPNEMGEVPLNIVFAPAGHPQTIEQMIASTERGILVTRLWYIREVEPFEKVLTGMTRDGTFLVENGLLKGGVRNFRFNESLIHMLSNVEAMSVPVRACGEESFDMVVPAMKVKEFNFTEVTKF